ncbi:C40 family peptidase [Streptomyces stelliscabiei]|uniref:C40 family peptidase n=1 Tax=Streptomyces TaxID=1883 RepID=UPI0006B351AB|nr:C40 family peptidase [Streptomyces sp. NRRL B-24085]
MKGVAAGIGAFVLSPLLLAGTAMLMASSSEAAQTTYSSFSCVGDVDTDAVVEQVTKILNGASAKTVHVEGLTLPEEQVPNAHTIVATGISLHVPKKGQVIALATAMQESRLRNLNSGDRDSLGLFQQRPSQGWGTAEEIRDPVYASTQFYTHLLAVSGWQQLTVTQAAQKVQRSAYPDAYADWEDLATALQKAIAATFPDASGTDTDSTPSTASCTATEDGSGYGTIPEGSVPKGYSIPKDADPKARKAIAWAMQQLDTMYQWGGTCTAPHGPDPMGRCDCSSLTQQAYGHAGIQLTRTTYTQINEGKAVSSKALKPGDLIFSRGSAARPEHVGLYMGSGLAIEAPRTGKPVRITPLADWDILAARRVI